MAEIISDVIKELIRFVGEASAIVHYFSDIMVVISVYNVIFEHGSAGAIIIWLITAVISAVIAELLKSRLPTPLRIVFRRKSIIWMRSFCSAIIFLHFHHSRLEQKTQNCRKTRRFHKQRNAKAFIIREFRIFWRWMFCLFL